MKSFIDSLSNGQTAVLTSLLSALIAAVVAVLTTRYTVKHGLNYAAQIKGLHDTIESLANTQEELRKQQAEQAKREDERYTAELRKIEASRWTPIAKIINVNEGREHVNKLSINSVEKFRVIDVALLSQTGARIYEFPFNLGLGSEAVVGQNIPIPHGELVKLANSNESFFQLERFEGSLKYTVERAEGDPVRYTGEVKFLGGTYVLGNTQWYQLVG